MHFCCISMALMLHCTKNPVVFTQKKQAAVVAEIIPYKKIQQNHNCISIRYIVRKHQHTHQY